MIIMVMLLCLATNKYIYAESLREKFAKDGLFSGKTVFFSSDGKIAEIKKVNGLEQIFVDGKQVTFLTPLTKYFAHGMWCKTEEKIEHRIYDIKWSPDSQKIAFTIDLMNSPSRDYYTPTVLVLCLNSLKLLYAGGALPGYSMDFYAYKPLWQGNDTLKFIQWMDGEPFKYGIRRIQTVYVENLKPVIHIPLFEEQNRRAGIKMKYPKPLP